MMRKFLQFLWLLLFMAGMASCGGSVTHKYETVKGDPLKARIYTLDNGMKVYMTVNKEQPRIQTYIAVRVGGKNDPAETTGLAHYFEHLMFKGTQDFGTQNYEQEKPMLDEIERLFEVYRKTMDEAQRVALYRQIDSISYEASKIAIPNEYDKLMAAIGATGTNAYTAYDMTVFEENIPSNEVENWAKIQANRFKNAVIRGFHTELETVYEEKNMSLTKDSRKVYEHLLAALFPHHPYGTQTVLGTQENLKNPSITNIKNYYKQWYVPNNMAICLSGDFDPDNMVNVLNQYFGDMRPSDSLPKLKYMPEPELNQPIVREVMGTEAEFVALGWRFPGAAHEDIPLLNLMSSVLSNDKAGMMDLDVNQQQKVMGAWASPMLMADYSVFTIQAVPKAGQSLEEAKDIVLEEIGKLKKGEFDESLLQAVVNNQKLAIQQQLEKNDARADWFVQTFINGSDWKAEVDALNNADKVTRQQIIDLANKYLKDDYVVIYKRRGEDNSVKKMTKPSITPIYMNRDTASQFLRDIQNTAVKPIEPVFLDYAKDMQQTTAKSGIPVWYKQNTTNGLASLTYLYEQGNNDNKKLETAAQYLDYLGTSKLSPEQVKEEFYRLACEYEITPSARRTQITITGLSENMGKAVELLESLLTDAQPDEGVLENLKADVLKEREDAKSNQQANFRKLMAYGMYGSKSPATHVLSNEELKSLTSEDLLSALRELNKYTHRVMYYGPLSQEKAVAEINKYHQVPEVLMAVDKADLYQFKETPHDQVLLAPYDAAQVYMAAISNRGEVFDMKVLPVTTLYNEYFGGGMNSIVFQEMRESRALAYSAAASMNEPSRLEDPYIYSTFIATQNDKMGDALATFNEIINNMPESEAAFALAKDGLLTRMRTERATGDAVFGSYLSAQELGLDKDPRRILFEEAQHLSLPEVKAFQEKWVKNRHYTYCVLGNEKDLDMKKLSQYGPVTRLTTEEIFGY